MFGEGMAAAAISAGINAYSAHKANKASKHENARNRAFQERMANSAHQREVTDLKKAGLNPILSGTGGSGANSPTGSVAEVIPESESPDLTDALRLANESSKTNAEVKNLESSRELINAQTEGVNLDNIDKKWTARQSDAKTTVFDWLTGAAGFPGMGTKTNPDGSTPSTAKNSTNAFPLFPSKTNPFKPKDKKQAKDDFKTLQNKFKRATHDRS